MRALTLRHCATAQDEDFVSWEEAVTGHAVSEQPLVQALVPGSEEGKALVGRRILYHWADARAPPLDPSAHAWGTACGPHATPPSTPARMHEALQVAHITHHPCIGRSVGA